MTTQDNSIIIIDNEDSCKTVLIPHSVCVVGDGTGTVLPVGNDGDIYQIVNGAIVPVPFPDSATVVVNADGSITVTDSTGSTTLSPGSSTIAVDPVTGLVTITTDDGNSTTFAPSLVTVTLNPDGTVTVTDGAGNSTILGAATSDVAVTNAKHNLEHTAVDGTLEEYDPGQSGAIQLSPLNVPSMVNDGGLFAFPTEAWTRTLSRIQLKSKTTGGAVDVVITHNGVSQTVTLPAGSDYVSVAATGFGAIADTQWVEAEVVAAVAPLVNGLAVTMEWE